MKTKEITVIEVKEDGAKESGIIRYDGDYKDWLENNFEPGDDLYEFSLVSLTRHVRKAESTVGVQRIYFLWLTGGTAFTFAVNSDLADYRFLTEVIPTLRDAVILNAMESMENDVKDGYRLTDVAANISSIHDAIVNNHP